MPVRIVTISCQFGSSVREIAKSVADLLGFEVVDKDFVMHVAEEAQVAPVEVERYDETGMSIVERFLRVLVGGGDAVVCGPALLGEVPVPLPPLTEQQWKDGNTVLDHHECLKFTQDVLKKLGELGKVVIVGRAGMSVLEDRKDALHVRLVAPLEWRVRETQRVESCSEEEARIKVEADDNRRSQYVKQFYGEDCANPELYHLVINVARVGRRDGVAQIIARAVLSSEVFDPAADGDI